MDHTNIFKKECFQEALSAMVDLAEHDIENNWPARTMEQCEAFLVRRYRVKNLRPAHIEALHHAYTTARWSLSLAKREADMQG